MVLCHVAATPTRAAAAHSSLSEQNKTRGSEKKIFRKKELPCSCLSCSYAALILLALFPMHSQSYQHPSKKYPHILALPLLFRAHPPTPLYCKIPC